TVGEFMRTLGDPERSSSWLIPSDATHSSPLPPCGQRLRTGRGSFGSKSWLPRRGKSIPRAVSSGAACGSSAIRACLTGCCPIYGRVQAVAAYCAVSAMNWIALRMLTGDRNKYLGLVFGVTFATRLMSQQVSIFLG